MSETKATQLSFSTDSSSPLHQPPPPALPPIHSCPPLLYQGIQNFFKVVNYTFYRTLEVRGTENLTSTSPIPTIIVPNHSNSLVDSVLVLISTEHHVRFLAKDTLWKDRIFGPMVAALGSIPIKRSKDHNGEKVDNSEIFQSLIESLSKGNTACLFPEGMSRYHPAMNDFKPGLGFIVLDLLLQNRHKKDFQVRLVPCALKYEDREKFRSSALIDYTSPVTFSVSYLEERIGKELLNETERKELPLQLKKQIAHEIASSLEKQLKENVLDAPDWKTLEAAFTASTILLNNENSPSTRTVSKHLDLVLHFLRLFKKNKEGSLQQPNALSIKRYQDLLDSHYLDDATVVSPPSVPFDLLKNFATTFLFLFLSAPGMIIYSPLMLLCKWKEKQLIARGKEGFYDEVAQYKQAYGIFYFTFLWFAFTFLHNFHWAWLSPLLFAGTLKAFDYFFGSCKKTISTFFYSWYTLRKSNALRLLQEERRNISAIITATVSERNKK